jgi:biotin/methionine sulfoxide reductase
LTGRVTSWPSVVEHCELFVAFGGLALKNAQVSSGGAAEHYAQTLRCNSWRKKARR